MVTCHRTYLDEDMPAGPALRVASEAVGANRGRCLEHWVPERDLAEVWGGEEELARGRKGVETCEVEGNVAAHGAGV